MKLLYAIALCCTIVSLLNGCALLLRPDTPNTIHVSSEPDKATVIVNGQRYSRTPAIIKLPASERYCIEYHKAGYRPAYDTVYASIGTDWLIADITCSMLTFGSPLVVDYLTGSWYEIDTNTRRSAVLIPDATVPPLPPAVPPVPIGLSIQLETGFTQPFYQVAVVPTHYGIGLGYVITDWLTAGIRQEMQGAGALITLPDSRNIMTKTHASLFVISTTGRLQFDLFDTGLYTTFGAGIMRASIGYFQTHVARGWLPCGIVGAGYMFSDEKKGFYTELCYTTTGPYTLHISPSDTKFSPYHTTIRAGYRWSF